MLTQQQIDQFHRDGFLVIRGLYAGRELELLRAAADRVEAQGVAEQGSGHLYREIAGKKTYFRSEQMWDRDPIFQAVTVKPAVLEAIGQCAGHPFLPVNDSFVCKIAGGNVPVEWHQDPPYMGSDPKFTETFEVPNFDTDIYLDDSTLENGCVWGIPGHHLVGHVDMKKFSQQELFENCGAVPILMRAGDVLFHSLSAPHGSAGNTSASKRRIFYVHYMVREVYDFCYSNWSSQKRGFSPAGMHFAQEMIAVRRQMGFPDISSDRVPWQEGKGFYCTGQPNTPPRYWGQLIAAMSQAEKARKRSLQATGATAAAG